METKKAKPPITDKLSGTREKRYLTHNKNIQNRPRTNKAALLITFLTALHFFTGDSWGSDLNKSYYEVDPKLSYSKRQKELAKLEAFAKLFTQKADFNIKVMQVSDKGPYEKEIKAFLTVNGKPEDIFTYNPNGQGYGFQFLKYGWLPIDKAKQVVPLKIWTKLNKIDRSTPIDKPSGAEITRQRIKEMNNLKSLGAKINPKTCKEFDKGFTGYFEYLDENNQKREKAFKLIMSAFSIGSLTIEGIGKVNFKNPETRLNKDLVSELQKLVKTFKSPKNSTDIKHLKEKMQKLDKALDKWFQSTLDDKDNPHNSMVYQKDVEKFYKKTKAINQQIIDSLPDKCSEKLAFFIENTIQEIQNWQETICQAFDLVTALSKFKIHQKNIKQLAQELPNAMRCQASVVKKLGPLLKLNKSNKEITDKMQQKIGSQPNDKKIKEGLQKITILIEELING